MLSATFNDRGGGADDPAFSVDLTSSTAIFRSPEILQIFRGNCYTSQGDPDSSFPLWVDCIIDSSSVSTVCWHKRLLIEVVTFIVIEDATVLLESRRIY